MGFSTKELLGMLGVTPPASSGRVKLPSGLHKDIAEAAFSAAGELTRAFFAAVDNDAPVENGHLHQTFGVGLRYADLPEAEPVASSMLSKGSNDPEATSRAYGRTTVEPGGLRVVVGTRVGFVQDLNDGMIFEPDVNGSKGYKEAGAAGVGELYGPRKADGPMGFLMWWSGGGKYFTQMHTWGPLGFFESAEMALESKAREMGMK
jgi:hypothetical protein